MAIQMRAAATRQKLVDAAVTLFADHGYEDTTPKAIAKAADLTAGAFYYHFKSKDDLGTAIVEQAWPNLAEALRTCMTSPGSGMESVVNTVFAVAEIINRDKTQWIAFHLNMAIAHSSPAARKAYRKRLEGLFRMLPDALVDSEIRVTRDEAGELLWIALTGAQLMSDALEETGPLLFDRLARACKSALRTIMSDEQLPRLDELVDKAAARCGRANAPEN